jgi:DNA-binding CsgD family transcriptional regulator
MGEYYAMTPNDPYMAKVSEFVDYIKSENPSINEMCQFAVIRLFSDIRAIAMFASVLESDGGIRFSGQFGFTADQMKPWENSSIEDPIPTADALRTNTTIWLADKEDWAREYSNFAKFREIDSARTFIALPITARGSHMSVLGILSSDSVAPTPGLSTFVETIAGLIALQMSQVEGREDGKVTNKNSILFSLFTRRQREIMRLIADGLTNAQIGAELDFSESTIRQESMRIYEILGASGRSDAIRMYRSVSVKV